MVGDLLCQRGFGTSELAHSFLEPRLQGLSDPFLLTDLEKAAGRLMEAIRKKERIVVYGDYDVDGITSSALACRVLRRLGADVRPFLPLRMEEGYGLSQEGVERCVEECRPELLLAVDCGTTAGHQVRWLSERGIPVIVVDHHALPPVLPNAYALVNPQRDGTLTSLASVGLVFKVCHGLMKLLPAQERVDLRDYLDLVALGTVADIVPLVEENRVFVRRGLRQMEQTGNVGLRALMSVSQVSFPVTSQDIGFRLGPRLNASGRLGDAMRSLKLLLTDNAAEAREIADELNVNNRERQAVESATFLEAERRMSESFDPARDFGLVLHGKFWHWGVIGIVASRLQKRCYRPTIVIGVDDHGIGKGSARSIDGVSIVAAIGACSRFLTGYGGHEMAAGLTIQEDKIEDFQQAFNQAVREQSSPELFHQTVQLAGSIDLNEVNEELFRQLEQLAPYGRENPEPVFVFEGLKLTRPARVFGRNHVKLRLRGANGSVGAIGFGLGSNDWTRPPGKLAGVLEWDDYRGEVQIRIIDWSWE